MVGGWKVPGGTEERRSGKERKGGLGLRHAAPNKKSFFDSSSMLLNVP